MAAWDGSGIQDGDGRTRLERLAGTTHTKALSARLRSMHPVPKLTGLARFLS